MSYNSADINEEEEDDDLFEDATEEQPEEEEDVEMEEAEDENNDEEDEDEGEPEGEDEDNEGEGEGDGGGDGDGDVEAEAEAEGDDEEDVSLEKHVEPKEEEDPDTLLEQQLEDSMMEDGDGDDEDDKDLHLANGKGKHRDTFKFQHPISPSEDAINCASYDIVPYVACLHASPVYCVQFSWGLRWMFTGGADGFIRRYNFFESVNNKLPLTVAQRHPFVDSVTRSGVISSYWENEQPVFEKDAKIKDGIYEPKVSPVHSLAVQSEALWLLAGLESGGITLQTIRHNEGQIQAYMDKHKSAVSVLKLDDDETRFLSGSWDKNLYEWDLDTGKTVRDYIGSTGQITSIEWQPTGGALVSQRLRDETPPELAKSRPTTGFGHANGSSKPAATNQDENEDEDDRKSMGSLFGSDDEDDGNNNNNDGEDEVAANAKPVGDSDPVAADVGAKSPKKEESEPIELAEKNLISQSVFLSASVDGTVDIWDRRQGTKAGHLYVPEGVPPWTTSACWSIDGNMVYVGRRNSCVDEFDIRSSLVKPSRRFKFPSVSGAVSTLAAMPSGHHLLCGSHDNVRLYDLKAAASAPTPFYIVPGHHGAVLSTISVDPSCRYMVTASGSRGWQGNSTDVALIYEVKPQKTVRV